ncbi:MAG: hypothetical protein A3D95_15815 [Betaproteobacteria bacterium RIFCSPHIGHO2_12_FULL_69_13]|nr:MAG: hypothetical protein A3D95_15815 [Betaproteobacteria bacterium RIFCSPHIGHO2_12_FULL_69_13]OGA67837.1 MAG: hypothetical protein A3G83_08170 [Betaproteobacteria bacterium RIFCSPLOWO2_12_FULL_68_20]
MLRILFGLALAAASAAAAAQELEPGEWRFTSTVTSPMLPKPQTMSVTQCVKREDAADSSRWMGKQDGDCKVTPGRKTGDSFSWEVSCPKSGMRGKGSVRYGRGTIESEIQMSGDMQGRKFDMLTKMSGRRLGPCK